jgi:hypothetical protein
MLTENEMHSDAVRCALLVAYTSLCEATSLATGKPVGELSDAMMGKMVEDGDLPPNVAAIVAGLIRRA